MNPTDGPLVLPPPGALTRGAGAQAKARLSGGLTDAVAEANGFGASASADEAGAVIVADVPAVAPAPHWARALAELGASV